MLIYFRLAYGWLTYHHHVVPLSRITLTLSRHFSQSFIASGRSSGLYPVSSHSCCMYVRAGRSAFASPYAEVHRSTSLMSSSLLLQQCPACLVRNGFIISSWKKCRGSTVRWRRKKHLGETPFLQKVQTGNSFLLFSESGFERCYILALQV